MLIHLKVGLEFQMHMKACRTRKREMAYLAKHYGEDEKKNEPSNTSEMERIKDLVFLIQGK